MKKILLVDELFVRAPLVEFLTRAGYEVFEAEDGREALHIIGQKPIDLVVAEIELNEINGLELSARSIDETTPFLFVSSDKNLLARAERLPLCQGTFLKVFQPSDLVEKIREILGE